MANVNHINIVNDATGLAYCRKLKTISVIDDAHMNNHCGSCSMYNGSAQGEGVECLWFDKREEVRTPHIVTDPQMEQNQIIIADHTVEDEKLIVKADKVAPIEKLIIKE